MDLIKACEMDQNRAIAQIAAYTSYLNGAHQGKGPTLFELAFWSVDTVGSPTMFIEATNLWMGSLSSHDLCRSGPLSKDFQTKSQKRKGNASANISAKDSHRHNTVQITTPTTKRFLQMQST
jgi:hypothetical protein